MKLIAFLLKNSRHGMTWAVVTGALSGICGAALIAIINSALASRQSGEPMTELILAFAALFVLTPITRFISEYLLLRLSQDTVYAMRMRLSKRILSTPLRRLESLGAPKLLVALTDDIMQITVALVELPTLVVNFTVIFGCFVYLGWLAPSLMLVALAFLVIGGGSYHFAFRFGMRRFRQSREKQDELFGHFRGMTEGAKELKLHARRRLGFLNLLDETALGLRKLVLEARTMFSVAANWGAVLFFLVIGLLLFLPQMSGQSNEALTGFTLVLLFIRGPLQMFLNTLPALGQGEVALQKIERLGLTLPVEASEAGPAEEPGSTWERLELAGVCHAYEREGEETSFTLGPFDLIFEPGELVFLVGGNGSGKTTFAKLLTGLYLPEAGEIRLNGVAVTDHDRERYRQHFTAVFAEFHLFDRLLGFEGQTVDQQARTYLQELRLAHKVVIQDGRLSTTDLSRGQRKRLALLTAYLEDRPLYVFDEWAADQDPQFKEIFYNHLLPDLKRRGKTVLVISHDDRYFGVADRVLKLEDGKLIEDVRVPHPIAASA
ncbi:MAG: putative pyoverdin transport system ATP-binding/permease protein [Acidobacteriota bacterium]|jgi:putative ATP-binding cassette transporter|nr:putative pyoverdin transport system ATP-binding/permease protein [Acidobacteriota bacterium]